MPSFSTLVGAFLGAASLAASAAVPASQPFEHFKAKRQSTNSSLEVDLGYEVYEGYTNQTTGINIWRGYVKTRLTFLSMLTIGIKYSFCCTSCRISALARTSTSYRES